MATRSDRERASVIETVSVYGRTRASEFVVVVETDRSTLEDKEQGGDGWMDGTHRRMQTVQLVHHYVKAREARSIVVQVKLQYVADTHSGGRFLQLFRTESIHFYVHKWRIRAVEAIKFIKI